MLDLPAHPALGASLHGDVVGEGGGLVPLGHHIIQRLQRCTRLASHRTRLDRLGHTIKQELVSWIVICNFKRTGRVDEIDRVPP
jgi:hypothetical protein